jgi:hypothetical protein
MREQRKRPEAEPQTGGETRTRPEFGQSWVDQQLRGHDQQRTSLTWNQAPPVQRLIVDDQLANADGSQLSKRAFLENAQIEVQRAIEPILVASGRSSDDCPYLLLLFRALRSRSAAELDAISREIAPKAATALEVLHGLRNVATDAATRWVNTGALGQLPTGLPARLARLLGDTGAPVHAAALQLGAGRSLDPVTASAIGRAFGTSFTHVRVHTGDRAARATGHARARAVAIGANIAFAPGEYAPRTLRGDALIAHELAHVAQQSGAERGLTQSRGDNNLAAENDATAAATSAVGSIWSRALGLAGASMRAALPRLRTGLRLRRCTESEEPTPYGLDEENPFEIEIVPFPRTSQGVFVQGVKQDFILDWPSRSSSQVFDPNDRDNPLSKAWLATAPSGDTQEDKWGGPRFEVTLDEAGEWLIAANVEPRSASSTERIAIIASFEVLAADDYVPEFLAQIDNPDYRRYTVGLAATELSLSQGAVKDQRAFGDPGPYITLDDSGQNPAPTTSGTANYYTMHPSAAATKFLWYIVADPEPLGGSKNGVIPTLGINDQWRRRKIDGALVFARTTTPSADTTESLSLSIANTYWIICKEYGADGKPLGTEAAYKQVVLNTVEQPGEELSEWGKLEAWRDHIKKVDERAKEVDEDTLIGVPAVHVADKSGLETPLALFLGRDNDEPGKVRLLDLTFRARKSGYSGDSGDGAIRDMRKNNQYPEGLISLQVPANSLEAAEGLTTFRVDHEEGLASKLSSWTGWASLGLSALGAIALFTPFAGASPYLFAAGGALGATSAGLSLYSKLSGGSATPRGVAIDLIALAASLVGLARAGGMLAKSGKLVTVRGAKYLAYSEYILEGGEGVLIVWDSVAAIDDVLDDPDLSTRERSDAIVRLLGQLALTGGLGLRSVLDPPDLQPPKPRAKGSGTSTSTPESPRKKSERPKRRRGIVSERELTPDDLGIEGTAVVSGTITLKRDGTCVVFVDWLGGASGYMATPATIKNPFTVVANLKRTAINMGAKKLRIEAIYANLRLRDVLERRYGKMKTDGNKDILEIDLEKKKR